MQGTEFQKQKLLTALKHVRYFLALMEEWTRKKEWNIFWEAQTYSRARLRDTVDADTRKILEAFAGGDLVACDYLVTHESALEGQFVQLGFNPKLLRPKTTAA